MEIIEQLIMYVQPGYYSILPANDFLCNLKRKTCCSMKTNIWSSSILACAPNPKEGWPLIWKRAADRRRTLRRNSSLAKTTSVISNRIWMRARFGSLYFLNWTEFRFWSRYLEHGSPSIRPALRLPSLRRRQYRAVIQENSGIRHG